ncbi:Phytanoyl-CoA dioxygenase [Pleurostoma richardsiae]|uniref:Phytanoyl-CoA dioxygenase n=1 Tax=Pleurostoma richardsiae TaxID=41990 RepID=A0AA38RSL4_9PEZI|nr:Phytanoyl-CoA dioxygenase [Pleurostoma richardsiae]
MPALTSRYPPGPRRVQTDTPLEDILELLKRDGGVVIEKLLDRATVEKAIAEITPRLEADKPWTGTFFPGETRRAPGMNAYSPTYTENFLMNPLYQAVSASTGIQVGPGAPDQEIHRDDYIHHNVHNEISEWVDERDLNSRESAVGLFVAGSKTTKANGATRFLPGSHLWGNDREPIEDDVFYAELNVGDAFIMLGSCYHGGSANTTSDQFRLVFSAFCTRGFLRQEENQYLIVSNEQLAKLNRKTQRVLGWAISEPYMGWVDFQDPLKLVYPEEFDKAPADLASGHHEEE